MAGAGAGARAAADEAGAAADEAGAGDATSEDQAVDAGDGADAAGAVDDGPAGPDAPADADDADEAADEASAESGAEPDSATEAEAQDDTAKPGKRRMPRLPAAALLALAVTLFVAAAAFAGAAVQPYLADRATVDIKQQVARAAVRAITTLWSYTPENIDTLSDRAGKYLTGDFGAQYRKFVDEKVVGPNKQFKMTNSTEVAGVAVESVDGPNAVVLVYTNTTATTPMKKNIPSLQYLSYRLIMRREKGKWLVSRMTTVTSLDVTPQV